MAKITMEIQFGELLPELYTDDDKEAFGRHPELQYTPEYYKACRTYNNKKKKAIERVVSKIERKFGNGCAAYYFDSGIIETFFDVYYNYIDEPDNSEKMKKKIISFLEKLEAAYPYASLSWYVSEQTFNNDDDD